MDKDKEDIQLKSEEFKEILEDIPAWIVRWGITVIAVFLIVLFIGSSYFKYPDTIQGTMILTSTEPPIELYTRSAGVIEEIYVDNGQHIGQDEFLISFAPVSLVENMVSVNSYLQEIKADILHAEFPSVSLQLGELQTSYLRFYNTLRNYHRSYSTIELENLQLSISQLQNDIMLWEEKNIIKSPVVGRVIYKDRLKKNQNLFQGMQVATILPDDKGELLGKSFISSFYLGKVKVGQSVNIYFDGYSANEYGVVKGTISYISPIPVDGNYLVEIKLPDTLETSYKKMIPYTPLMNAKIDIITQDYSIMERFLSLVKRF